jgi:hypothetical protein
VSSVPNKPLAPPAPTSLSPASLIPAPSRNASLSAAVRASRPRVPSSHILDGRVPRVPSRRSFPRPCRPLPARPVLASLLRTSLSAAFHASSPRVTSPQFSRLRSSRSSTSSRCAFRAAASRAFGLPLLCEDAARRTTVRWARCGELGASWGDTA